MSMLKKEGRIISYGNAKVVRARWDNVVIQNGLYGYLKLDKNEKLQFHACGGAVIVKRVLINLKSGEQYLVLNFVDAGGNKQEQIFPREDLTESGVLKLTAVGMQITRKTADYFIKSLENQESSVPHEYFHDDLGFGYSDKKEKNPIFKAFKAIGINNGHVSKYMGDFDVKKTGSLKCTPFIS